MARIRSVHPDICVSETIEALDDPNLEVTFVRLWTHCDDHGRGVDNLLLIKAAIYPLRERVTAEVLDAWLDELAYAGLIIRYQTGGKRFLAVRSWGEFQHPNRPKDSKYPAPPDNAEPPRRPTGTTPPDNTRHAHVTDASVTTHVRDTPGEGGEKEREREREKEPSRACTSTALTLVHGNPSSPTATAPPPSTDFDAFWQLYPRKVARKEAQTAWRKARGHADWHTITNGLRAATAAWQAERRPADKIPHAATWLNGRRWEDDHTTPAHQPAAEPKGFAGIRAALDHGNLA